MNAEHWQTISEALHEERVRLLIAQEGWKETSATYKRLNGEIARIDAALAAVEAAQQPAPQAEWEQKYPPEWDRVP